MRLGGDESEKGRLRIDRDINVALDVSVCHTLNPMVDTTIYRWAGGELVIEEWCDTNPGAVRVADSFLVVDGSVASLDRHCARFARGLGAQNIDADVARFVASVTAVLPREGRWFPRIEAIDYGGGALLRLLVRPAPDPVTTLRLATASYDPRTNHTVKGPDLANLGKLRRDSGADEAVLLTDGFVTEGAWSSVVWWQNEELHRVDSTLPRLASVTESIVMDLAQSDGVSVVDTRATPEDLSGAEVWILSALHGIRVATDWAGGPELSNAWGRADDWRARYADHRTRL